MLRRDIIDTEMKTPAENARTFLSTLCVGFTVVMVVCMVFGSIFADDGARQGINYCWSILAACAIAAALQFVFFTPALIRRMAYPTRLAIFGICLYAILAVAAVAMNWFPVGVAGAWVSFTVTYLVILAAMTAFFHFKMKRDCRALNEKLAEYRSETPKG